MKDKGIILVIDDNLVNLKLLNVLLSHEGYDVHTASNAQETFKVLANLQPKLILMDIQLVGMDGIELTKRIKDDPNFSNIPIIAITAYAMKGDKERILAAGCDQYITKPIDNAALLEIVAKSLAAS